MKTEGFEEMGQFIVTPFSVLFELSAYDSVFFYD